MGLAKQLHSGLWKVLPASFFDPKAGDLTIEGLALSENPPLSEDELSKFAVFSDSRFYMAHLFEKLLPFLPQGFEVIDRPNGQNCFMYCMDIHKPKRFGRKEFDQELALRGYRYFGYSEGLVEVGDIIVYSVPGFIDSIRQHAGVYVGAGRVRSRWGYNSPLVEHPLEEVITDYWNKDKRYLTIERKVRQK